MISLDNLIFFLLATLLLNITPGSDMLYVVGRSLGQGTKAGVISAFGISVGCLVHTLAAIAGISAVISSSPFLFEIIKFSGAGYLIYLGLKSLISKKSGIDISAEPDKKSLASIFNQGIVTNVLNPKVALFFLAFLPQFIDPGSSAASLKILLLGILFNISGTAVNCIVAAAFGKGKDFLSRYPFYFRIQDKITGTMLVLLGVKMLFLKK